MHSDPAEPGLRQSDDSSEEMHAKDAATRPDGTSKAMLFVHIPKTAGTSLRHGVAEFLGKQRLVLDYGPKQPATSWLVNRWRYNESKPDKFRTAFDARGKKFLSGHIRLADYVGGFDLDNVAVFLRDPVQRVVSEYNHYVRNYGYDQSLEVFAETAVFQNKQTRALSGVPIEMLGVVGLVERYEESLSRINAHFGWQVPQHSANLGRAHVSEPYRVDRPIRRLLERNNPLDLALYDKARAYFENPDAARFQAPCSPATGSCKLESDNTIRGWACQIGSERATIVRVEVNGEIKARVAADLFRPDIRRRGLKRSGCAGFQVQVPSISPGDEIRCFEADGDTELHNSPLRCGATG